MAKGLDKILRKISENPKHEMLKERYLALVEDIPDIALKTKKILSLAEVYFVSRPEESLEIAINIYRKDKSCVEAFRIAYASLKALDLDEKAEILKVDFRKNNQSHSKNSSINNSAAELSAKDPFIVKKLDDRAKKEPAGAKTPEILPNLAPYDRTFMDADFKKSNPYAETPAGPIDHANLEIESQLPPLNVAENKSNNPNYFKNEDEDTEAAFIPSPRSKSEPSFDLQESIPFYSEPSGAEIRTPLPSSPDSNNQSSSLELPPLAPQDRVNTDSLQPPTLQGTEPSETNPNDPSHKLEQIDPTPIHGKSSSSIRVPGMERTHSPFELKHDLVDLDRISEKLNKIKLNVGQEDLNEPIQEKHPRKIEDSKKQAPKYQTPGQARPPSQHPQQGGPALFNMQKELLDLENSLAPKQLLRDKKTFYKSKPLEPEVTKEIGLWFQKQKHTASEEKMTSMTWSLLQSFWIEIFSEDALDFLSKNEPSTLGLGFWGAYLDILIANRFFRKTLFEIRTKILGGSPLAWAHASLPRLQKALKELGYRELDWQEGDQISELLPLLQRQFERKKIF